MNTMPFCSTACSALAFQFFFVDQFRRFFFAAAVSALLSLFSLRVFLRSPPMIWNMLCSWLVISSMPGGAMISTPIGCAADFDFDFFVVQFAFAQFFAEQLAGARFCSASVTFQRVTEAVLRAGGSSASRTRSSAASAARELLRVRFPARESCLIDISTRSRMIDSTSRPT